MKIVLIPIPLSKKVKKVHGPERGVFHEEAHRQLSASERIEQVARLTLEEGRIVARRLEGKCVDLKNPATCVLGPKAILYISPGVDHVDGICHGSCTWGRKVYFAGEIKEDDKGGLIFTNKSGHYRPREDQEEIQKMVSLTDHNVRTYFKALGFVVTPSVPVSQKGIYEWPICPP